MQMASILYAFEERKKPQPERRKHVALPLALPLAQPKFWRYNKKQRKIQQNIMFDPAGA